MRKINPSTDKILLAVFPFMTPLMPPLGISCIKGFLSKRGYKVKTVDVMADITIREACYHYFDALKRMIPEEKRGHFFNVGLDVLCNHFMAHINYDNKEKYMELVKLIVQENFFVAINDEQVEELIEDVDDFFSKLGEYTLRLIDTEKPAVFGTSVYRGTLAASLFALKLVKERYPEILTVMGGAIFSQELFTGTPNYNLFMEKTTYLDKILIGEGENLFLRLLQGKLPEEQKTFSLKDINDELLDLNSLELPNFDDYELSKYAVIPAYTSRGCIYHCSFCAETMYWKKYRKKDAKNCADGLMELYRRYNRNLFVFTDCLINPVVTELSQEMINRRLSLYWDVYIKVDNNVCDPEYTHLWRKGGFYRARLGVESGSQRVLDLIDKRITVDQTRRALKSLAEAGIKTTTFWFSGHPGETEDDFQQTLDLLDEMQDYIYEAECDPFRYFYTGQTSSENWSKSMGNRLLYPEDATNMLLTQTWTLNTEPSREVVYDRACRFRNYCKKLGIPNPYSVTEIYQADERWKQLHKNAVPSIIDIQKGTAVPQENLKINRVVSAEKQIIDVTDFAF